MTFKFRQEGKQIPNTVKSVRLTLECLDKLMPLAWSENVNEYYTRPECKESGLVNQNHVISE